jgi:hypothetical protein
VTRVAALAAAVFLACGLAAARPLTDSEYSRVLTQVAGRLVQAAAARDGVSLTRAALDGLPDRCQVQAAPNAPPLAVDNRELLRRLRRQVAQGPDGVRFAAQVVQNLAVSCRAGPRPAPPTHAHRVLAEVLSRPEFHPSPLAGLQARFLRWIGRAVQWVLDTIASVLDRLTGLGPRLPRRAQRAILVALLVLSAGATLVLIARLALRIASSRTGPRPATAAGQGRDLPPHQHWLSQAEAATRSQDYRAAVRALHMAALMRLDEGGRISYVSSQTDRRFVRALKEHQLDDLSDSLAALNRLFAVVWYGFAPAGPDEYRLAREHWSRLEALSAP